MRPLRLCLAPLASALLLVACGGDDDSETTSSTRPSSTTLQGVVVLRPPDSIISVGGYYETGQPCDGASALTGQDRRTRTFFGPPASEVRAGTSVSVADDKGQTIGVGRVETGKWIEHPTNSNLVEHTCEMPFAIQLSRSSPFYAVQVGTQPVQRFAADSPVSLTFRGSGTLS